MPYDPQTGRTISEEEARALEEGAPRPPLPAVPEPGPGLLESLGDVATDAVSTALDIGHRIQAVAYGQEDLPLPKVGEGLPGAAMQGALRGALTSLPLVGGAAVPKEVKGPLFEVLGLPVRASSAIISPTLEAARRWRMGEDQQSLRWYALQGAREVFHAPEEQTVLQKLTLPFGDYSPAGALLEQVAPSLREAPEIDRFRAGVEIAGGHRDPRWWSLLVGEGAELAPIVPLLLISRGPATRRVMQREGARAAVRTSKYLIESAERASRRGARVAEIESLIDASKKVEGPLRSAVDRWWGRRADIGENFRRARQEGRGLLTDEVIEGFAAADGRLLAEVQQTLEGTGMGSALASAASRHFANEVIWGTETAWRFAGLRLGRRPGRPLLRGRVQTRRQRESALVGRGRQAPSVGYRAFCGGVGVGAWRGRGGTSCSKGGGGRAADVAGGAGRGVPPAEEQPGACGTRGG